MLEELIEFAQKSKFLQHALWYCKLVLNITKCGFMSRKNSWNIILTPYLEIKLYLNITQISNI